MMTKVLLALAVAAMATTAPAADPPPASGKYHVYLGTYTSKDGAKGIYRSELTVADGTLSEPELVAELVNPTFLTLSPDGKFLYAVGETSDVGAKKEGRVFAFAVDATTGKLTKLNEATSGSAGPCHVAVNKTGRFALVSNYGGGSAAMFKIEENGTLGERVFHAEYGDKDAKPPKVSHAHCGVFRSAGSDEYAYVVDLGRNTIFSYKLDHTAGTLTPTKTPELKLPDGTGPRHIAFYGNSGKAYVCGELDSTLHTIRAYDADGTLQLYDGQTVGINKRADAVLSTLPAGADAKALRNSTAEVIVHPDGKHVLVSNRGHNSLAVFEVNADKTTAVGHVTSTNDRKINIPRNFNADPTGKWLLIASQDGNEVRVAEWADGQAKLTATAIKVGRPVCVKFLAKK